MPDSLFHSYQNTRHFGSLNGLRFLCISAVMWHHFPIWPAFRDTAILAARGHVGVDFFFVLSGFLITTLLIRERQSTGRINLRGFYWRRLLRIVPIYLLVVLTAATFEIYVRGNTEKIGLLPYYLLFLSNFLTDSIIFLEITWSLAMEEQFYLIWPALLILLPRRWVAPVLLGLIAINVLSAMGVFNMIGISAFQVGVLRFALHGATFAPLLMGALAALILSGPRGFSALARVTAFPGAPLVYVAALLFSLTGLGNTLEGVPNLFVHLSMTLMLVSLVVREDNVLAPLLKWRPVDRIGEISYGMYLYHHFALAVTWKITERIGLDNLWLTFFMFFALTVVLSEISFRTFERFFMGFRKVAWGKVPKAPDAPA